MDTGKVFDVLVTAVAKAGAITHFAGERVLKLQQIRSAEERRCGNCWKWMTRHCVPERHHGDFKSMSSSACRDFELSDAAQELAARFRRELEAIPTPEQIMAAP